MGGCRGQALGRQPSGDKALPAALPKGLPPRRGSCRRSGVTPPSLSLPPRRAPVILGRDTSPQPTSPWGSPRTLLASAAVGWQQTRTAPAGGTWHPEGLEGWEGIDSLGCSPEGVLWDGG